MHNIFKKCKFIEDPTVGALCFDLQQALPTPKLSTSLQFYKCKLWTYNFCVHDIKTGKATMYLWNETQGKRGSAEIIACVKHFITHYVDRQVTTLKLFSDNCPGQNKNINMVLACVKLIHEGRFHTIEHFFMVPGHSYLPCDRNFGHIERKVRGVEVFSQPNYVDIIKASRTTRPFNVVSMDRQWFLDVEILQTKITNRSRNGAIFSNGKVFIYTDNYKQGFGIKAAYHQEDFTKVKLQKGRSNVYNNNTFDLSKIHPSPKYQTPVKLNEKKLQDVKALLTYIPTHHKPFMEDLITEQGGLKDVGYVNEDHDDDILDYC